MKNIIINILIVLMFLTGLGILLYPSVSNIINTEYNEKRIAEYESVVAKLTPVDYSNYFKRAREYNEKLKQHIKVTKEDYDSQLNIGGVGIMGYVEIPKIDVKLPIYHGVEKEVLQIGIGHISQTTLPIGGEGTHAAISGHRGLPSAKLFTDLDQIELGDIFNIYVLDEIFSYKVDNISVVEPNDSSSLGLYPGCDYVTLVTCTPYGINTQRLLIRGTRVEYKKNTPKKNYDAEAYVIDPNIVATIAGSVILTIIFIVLMILNSKKFRKKGKYKND